jgi:hypothetical protein
MRLKGWDYYYVSNAEFHLSVALVDLNYAGNVFLTYYSKAEGATTQEQVMVGPWHGVTLSPSSSEGTASFQSGDWSFTFVSSSSEKVLTVSAPVLQVSSSQGFKATLSFKLPEASEGLFVMTPLTADKSKFFISHKSYGYEVSGEVAIHGKHFAIDKEPGVMDWVRSNWPYTGGWIWATGNTQKTSPLKASLNLSAFSVSSTGPSEDAVFIEGKLIKLSMTTFKFDPQDLTQVIAIASLAGSPTESLGVIQGVFRPEDSYSKTADFLVVSSELVMLFGEFDVSVRTMEADYHFRARGLVEIHKSRW